MREIIIECSEAEAKIHMQILQGSEITWLYARGGETTLITIQSDDVMTFYHHGRKFIEALIRYRGSLGDYLREWRGYQLYASKLGNHQLIKIVDFGGNVIHTIPFTPQFPSNINKAMEAAKTWINALILKPATVHSGK